MASEQNGESLEAYLAAARREQTQQAERAALNEKAADSLKDHNGSPLEWFFDEREIGLCRQFLARMAATGYEKSLKVSGPSIVTQEQYKGWFGVLKTRQILQRETLFGYDIGWAVKPHEKPSSMSPSDVTQALLCSDGNIHLKGGGSVPSNYTIAPGRTNIRTTTERDLYDSAWLIQMPLGERLAQIVLSAD